MVLLQPLPAKQKWGGTVDPMLFPKKPEIQIFMGWLHILNIGRSVCFFFFFFFFFFLGTKHYLVQTSISLGVDPQAVSFRGLCVPASGHGQPGGAPLAGDGVGEEERKGDGGLYFEDQVANSNSSGDQASCSGG